MTEIHVSVFINVKVQVVENLFLDHSIIVNLLILLQHYFDYLIKFYEMYK